MGLAIARSIAEPCGGRLRVTPNESGGVTFHLALPLALQVGKNAT